MAVRSFALAFACVALAASVCLVPAAAPVHAQADKQDKGAKLPRFASLRSGEVNVRTGPGARYPVDWVFKRQNMPVEILAEYDTWREVRDWQGTKGWVHQAMLTAQRNIMVTGDAAQALLRKAEDGAQPVAKAEPGVIALLRRCEMEWCLIQIDRVSGWVRRKSIWGVYTDEDVK